MVSGPLRGYRRVHKLFRDDEMVCTKTRYNEQEMWL